MLLSNKNVNIRYKAYIFFAVFYSLPAGLYIYGFFNTQKLLIGVQIKEKVVLYSVENFCPFFIFCFLAVGCFLLSIHFLLNKRIEKTLGVQGLLNFFNVIAAGTIILYSFMVIKFLFCCIMFSFNKHIICTVGNLIVYNIPSVSEIEEIISTLYLQINSPYEFLTSEQIHRYAVLYHRELVEGIRPIKSFTAYEVDWFNWLNQQLHDYYEDEVVSKNHSWSSAVVIFMPILVHTAIQLVVFYYYLL